MAQNKTVFTPLRLALMVAIVLSNAMAWAAQWFPEQPWSYPVGIYGVVFILLFVFVILLEMVWVYHMRKGHEDVLVKRRYSQALVIYAVLFVSGFWMVYQVLSDLRL